MRAYNLIISDSKTGKVVRNYSSFLSNGSYNTAALTLELNVPLYAMASPMGMAMMKIWGISLQDIGQASDLNGQTIRLYAGMASGLPLANPAQYGLILEGTIYQAFGNWQGTNQTLDIIAYTYSGTASQPANLTLNWKKGVHLGTAIANTLATAFPTMKAIVNISPNIILSHDEPGYYSTLTQFAEYIKGVSQTIIGGSYSGVDMCIKNNQIIVYDGTSKTSPLQINFVDLIGQPTWIGPQQINVRSVLRSDINVGDYIKMPTGSVTTITQSSQSQYRNKSAFQSTFQVVRILHAGNSRQADANSWITSIDSVISV